jgi:hypothetical protein
MPLYAAVAAVLFAALSAPSRAQPAPAPPDAQAPVDCSDPKLDDAERAKLKAAGRCAVAATARTTPPPPKSPQIAARAVAPLSGVATATTAAGLGKTFDGGGGGTASGAVTAGAPATTAPPATPEARFAAAFTGGIEKTLATTETGTRVLDRLNASDGTRRLPTVAIVDLGGGSVPALFDRWAADPAMQLDRKHVADAALEAVPAADREKLARRWKDPAKLAAALADDPALMASVVSHFDATVVHEYTHAWQLKRDRPLDLAAYGNKEPIEWEVEAYREQMRYYHEKLMRDASAATADWSDTQTYQMLLGGYDAFRDWIVALYAGQANGSFEKLQAALSKRKGGAAGAAQAAAVRDEYAAREAAFIHDELPKIQAEGYSRLIAHYTDTGHPDKALKLLAFAPDAVRAERGPAALTGTTAYLKRVPPAPVDERIDAWQAYLAYLVKTTGSNEMSYDLFLLYQRDYRAAFDEKAAEAASARTPGAKRDALEAARAYASYLPDAEKKRLLQSLVARK